MQFWTQPAVYAQELLVHDCSQGERTERLHTRLVYFLRVFVLALEFEGKVICQMPALMIATKQP